MKTNELSSPSFKSVRRESLREELQQNSEKCFECKLCVKECAFLLKYGTPKQIADGYDPVSPVDANVSFECSLCGLCGAVCPAALNPGGMFLEMRREAVERGLVNLAAHSLLVNYEKRGTSKHFSWYGLPENCGTVLFPGCALAGSRPETVKKLFDHLSQDCPDLGIVFDCCTKPSHDLGREEYFHSTFNEMKTFLISSGVKKVLVACPSCWQIFHDYGGPLQVETVYEHLSGPAGKVADSKREVTVHDACATRENTAVHRAVRRIADDHVVTVQEMDHRGMKTFCCGEGGVVYYVKPDFAEKWTKSRIGEADGRMILTYCAGCSHFLGGGGRALHVLDLVFNGEKALSGRAKAAKTPFTYYHRLRLKSYFRKKKSWAVSHERGRAVKAVGGGKALVILACLVAMLAVLSIPLFLLVAFF